MKQVMLDDVGKVSIHEAADYDRSTLHSEEALVKVMACGICGSDYHYFRNGGLGSNMVPFPFKLGHEVAGIVEACNDGSLIGRRVAVEPNSSCGICDLCMMHRSNICKHSTFLGANADDSGLQEYIKVNINQLHLLEPNQTYNYGVMMEGLGVAMHNVDRAELSIEQITLGRVLVLGSGPIGILTGLVAQNRQNDEVTMVDPFVYRLKFGASLGLHNYKVTTTVLDNSKYDTVFDCAGTQDSYDMAIRAADSGANIILCGIPEVDFIHKNPHIERVKELTMINTRRSAVTYDEVDQYAVGFKLPLEKFVNGTRTFELAQEAFEISSQYREGIIKMVLIP